MYNSEIDCTVNSNEWPGCIKISRNSNLELSESKIFTLSTQGVTADFGSVVTINNSQINRTDLGEQIFLKAFSGLEVGAGSGNISLNCYGNSYYVNYSQMSVDNLNESCTKYD